MAEVTSALWHAVAGPLDGCREPPGREILSGALKLLIENGLQAVSSALGPVGTQECPAELAKCWGQTVQALADLLAVVTESARTHS